MKNVAAAIIINKGKVLIGKRSKGDKLAGKWEFPGGKIEKGEIPEGCLVREIKEELDILIEVGEFVGQSLYEYDFGKINLLVYKARWIDGKLNVKVHSEVRWVPIEELKDYDFAPADISIINKINTI